MIKFIINFVKNYFHYGVSRSSANLAYYLMFSFFPLIIFLNSVLGLINISTIDLYRYIDIFPKELQIIVSDYLEYLSGSDNIVPLFLGLFLMIWSFTRYVNSLFHIINNIYGFQKPKLSMIKSFFFTISMMLSVYLTLILSVVGGAILKLIYRFITFPPIVEKLFSMFRYLIPISYFFLILILLYRFVPVKKQTFKSVFAGAFCAVIALFILSGAFSIYIAHFSNYGVVYGSLSAVMFLMMWLYFSSMVIIQGSILNKMLSEKS
ncbi:MAG: YihY/virulence factor BrkB family protein [Clostridia bacterium]